MVENRAFTTLTEKVLEKKVSHLTKALKDGIHAMSMVHKKPVGSTKRCPDHVNKSVKRLCRAIKAGKEALSWKEERVRHGR